MSVEKNPIPPRGRDGVERVLYCLELEHEAQAEAAGIGDARDPAPLAGPVDVGHVRPC